MRPGLHLLTFGWHDRYIVSLAQLGHRWDLVPRRRVHGFLMKPHGLPSNVDVVPRSLARQRAARRRYDVVIAHTALDVQEFAGFDLPTVWVTHSSDSHAADAHVIPYGIDLHAYEMSARDRRVILVANDAHGPLPNLDDDGWLEGALAGLPIAVHSPAHIVERCRHSRVFLDATRVSTHDDCSYSMLDAMACGLPVVSRSSCAGLIVDGVNGFVADDASRIRERLLELLEDDALASRVGLAARQTIAERFPIEPFVAQWQALLASVAADPHSSRSASRAARSAVAVHSSLNSAASFVTSVP